MSLTFFLLLAAIAIPPLLIVAIMVDAYRNENIIAREGGTQRWWQ